jgi:hypothetical protein
MGLVQFPQSGGATLKKQIFTSSGTFTLPSGFSASKPLWAKVTAVGGGGGGGSGYTAGGGGAGAVVVKDLAITGNLPIIIGSGGNHGAESSNGGRGGDTIVGTAPTRPTNLVRNPFQVGLYGQWDTTAWSQTNNGSMSVFRSDYSSTTNQFLRNRHFIVGDTNNFQGVFKSSYGITLVSTSGDSNTTFLSDFFDTDAGVLHYYGVYTRLGQSSNTVTVTLEWYDAAGNQLNTANLATFNFTNTDDRKTGNSATSPVGTTRGRLRINMRCASTNHFSQIFGCYVSQEVDCAWQDAFGANGYWTGARYTSYLTRLTTTGLTAGTTGIVAGGGGGGGRAADEGNGGWMQHRFGGPGGHMGGYGTGHSNDSTGNSITFGGDGGGAGGAPYREVFRATNNTTPYSSSDGQGFVGQNGSGIWRTFGWRMPVRSHFLRHPVGNAGTSAIYLHTISSNEFGKFRIEGSRPHASGFGAGGPGCGYANFTENENPTRYFYNEGFAHYKELPYGNGGAATQGLRNLNTTNYGDIDYYINGEWSNNGDPGIVIFEWLES